MILKENTMINYREIKVDEKEQLKELMDTVLGDLERKEFFIPFTEQELEDMFNPDKVIIYGAYDGKKLVGTAQIFFYDEYTKKKIEILNINSDKIADLGGYLVLEEYRNRGIMKHLEEMLISKVKEMNYEYVVITAHPDNIASNKAIEHIGAKIVKTINIGDYLRNIYLLEL